MAKSRKNTVSETGNVKPLTPSQEFDQEKAGTTKRIRYMEGHPKQYRFDAKEGDFNINGTESLGSSFTFQPIAWRIFRDNILNMGTKNWVEFFFIDEKNCLSAVLFHGYSVENVYKLLIQDLFYNEISFCDVVITAVAERKENTKIQPKGTYSIASFSCEIADAATTQALKGFAESHRIFREETLTDMADFQMSSNYFNPFADTDAQGGLPVGTITRQIGQVSERKPKQDDNEAAAA